MRSLEPFEHLNPLNKKYKNMKYLLVVAHPDDEVIASSSISTFLFM